MDGSVVAGDLKLEDVLSHYGVKGMHWGIRKARNAPPGPAPSGDANRTSEYKSRAKAGGAKALSTKELQELVTRMNLEQQYDRLRPPTKKETVVKFIADTLVQVGKQQAAKVASDLATKQVKKVLGG